MATKNSFFSKYVIENTQEYAPTRSHEFYVIHLSQAPQKGMHLVAGEDIRKGATIATDGGEVVSSVADAPKGKKYAVSFREGLYLGPLNYDIPEKLWFINHSCNPNMARIGSLVYIAKRDIAKGEELTVDYAPLVTHVPAWRMECSCQSSNCRRVITGEDWHNRELAEEMFAEWLPHIQRQIAAKR